MTRKHFIMLSNALREAREQASQRLASGNNNVAATLYGVTLAADSIADALAKEVGRSFEKERFLKDAGAA